MRLGRHADNASVSFNNGAHNHRSANGLTNGGRDPSRRGATADARPLREVVKGRQIAGLAVGITMLVSSILRMGADGVIIMIVVGVLGGGGAVMFWHRRQSRGRALDR